MTPRSPWITVPIFFGLFFGGGIAGDQLARQLAPDSVLAALIGFLVFPTAFGVGILARVGASLPAAVRRLLRLIRRQQQPRSSDQQSFIASIPPGFFSFVPAAAVTCTLWGVVIAMLSSELVFVWVICLYAVVGVGYGVTCWKLAERGLSGFPTDS